MEGTQQTSDEGLEQANEDLHTLAKDGVSQHPMGPSGAIRGC